MPDIIDTDATLFERLRPRLRAISLRIVGSAADAEDVVQDCWFKWRAAEQDALDAPAAWLTTVVQRQSIDRLRRRAREAQAVAAVQATLDEDAAAADGPEHALLRRAALEAALARLLDQLSPAERLALVLADGFGCDGADVAAALGTTPANARQHLSRARRRLRAHADEVPPDERLCRELVRRFQAALDGVDVPAMTALLTHPQPLAVRAAPDQPQSQPQTQSQRTGPARACANDASYRMRLAA